MSDTSNETGNLGQKLLDHVWFCTIQELHDIAMQSELPQDRISAADTLLRYFTSMNTGINAPMIPISKPSLEEIEEELREDDDDE